jgi:hypothetical protein
MGQREKLSLVYDADGSIGVVMEFSESDFEAYSMPDLALVGAFQTKAGRASSRRFAVELVVAPAFQHGGTSGRCLLTASRIGGKRGATSRCPFWS